MLTYDLLETRAMCAAHHSTLDLAVGQWDAQGVFQETTTVHAGDSFEFSGCGFDLTYQSGGGGGSTFSGQPIANYEYLYSVDVDGCIQQGGSATYIAPTKPGWYSVEFHAWPDSDSQVSEGVYWVHVKK